MQPKQLDKNEPDRLNQERWWILQEAKKVCWNYIIHWIFRNKESKSVGSIQFVKFFTRSRYIICFRSSVYEVRIFVILEYD